MTRRAVLTALGGGATIALMGGARAQDFPVPQSGFWRDASGSGRWVALEVGANRFFIACLFGRRDGSPVWSVASGDFADGACAGQLSEYVGSQSLGSGPPANARVADGSWSFALAFTSPSAGLLFLGPANGGDAPMARITLERVAFGSGAPAPDVVLAPGWYWNPAEPGTGYFLEQQGASLTLVCALYGASVADSRAEWYSARGDLVRDAASGVLTLTANLDRPVNIKPAGAGAWAASATTLPAGSVSLRVDPGAGLTLTMPNGRQVGLVHYGAS